MKLLFIIVVILVVYVFIRRASASHSISADHYRPPQPPTINAHPTFVDPPQQAATDAKAQYAVTRYYFAHTDADSGPADPDVFYDELFIDLKNTDTGEKFENHMFVCTPRGLTEEMMKEQWDSVVGTELLIVRRYNLEAILTGAKHHLEEIYEAAFDIAPRRPGKRDYVG